MTEPDNIVLEHLRHICGAVDILRDDMHEVKHGVARVNVGTTELSERVDRVSDRLEPVEKRLDLTDA